jgi:hypothetical protein
MREILSRITTYCAVKRQNEHLVSCKIFGWVSELLNLYDNVLGKQSLSFLEALQTYKGSSLLKVSEGKFRKTFLLHL